MSARVLVDTSIWIDFFRGTLKPKPKEALVLILEAEEVAISDVIKHELLVGATSKKDYLFLSDAMGALTELALDSNTKAAFNQFGFDLKLKGLLGKYTDLSIAFLAQSNGLQVYSQDLYFKKLADRKIITLFEP